MITYSSNELKDRYVTDSNSNPSKVNKVYIGDNLVHLHLSNDTEFVKRVTCNGEINEDVDVNCQIEEVRGKSIVWNQLLQQGKLVDMGLPSGTLWASCNIDVTQPNGFAASPFQYECSFFSWGNVDGHNPISNSAFDYNWGDINQSEPYYEGQVYGETQGNTLTGNIPVGDTYDAARANVGSLWRMPTNAEFAELFANIKYINADGTEVDTTKADKRVSMNGVMGLYLESKLNGARLFFSCSGNGGGRTWSLSGSNGYYWSSTWNSARYARNLGFSSGGVNPQSSNYRYYGFALRPVISKSVVDNGKGGHKYAQYNNNISDLTLMFGSGNEPNSAADVVKMFPLDYYDYNAGEIIPFAGQNLVTTGKNQYNPTTGKANLLGGQTYQIGGTYTSATIDEVAVTLDSNNCFTTTEDCVLDVTGGNDTNTFVGLYNGKTNTYEPYEKHTLPLDPSQWRDNNGNLVFPYGGMHGVGNVYDYAKVDADGYISKVNLVYDGIDLGNYDYTKQGDLYTTAGFVPPKANMLFGRGKSIVWNQLINNGNFESTQRWNYGSNFDGTMSVANNIITLTVTGSRKTGQMIHYSKITAGHKYYFTSSVNPSIQTIITHYVANIGVKKGTVPANVWTRLSSIVTASASSITGEFNGGLGALFNIGDTISYKNIFAVDLTRMFGAGNEPATVEEFEAMFPLDYYAYDAGSLGILANQTYADAAAFKAAMQGIPLIYELATPVEVELATPIYAKYLANGLGTEEISPANTSTPTTTPANMTIDYRLCTEQL